MTYTTQQLQAMSDFEVNRALARKIMDKQGAPYNFVETKPTKLEDLRGTDLSKVVSVVCGFGFRLDYCNKPNDIMPLAFDRRIGISTYLKSDDWMAFMCDNSGKSFIDTNPLRAIACLLLMMDE